MNKKETEAYLKYISRQMAVLHDVLLFDDDVQMAQDQSIRNTKELYGVFNPAATKMSDEALIALAIKKGMQND